MAKITNKQTRPTDKRVFNAGELALRANAAAVADLDLSEALGQRVVEFAAMFTDLTVEEFSNRRACWVAAYTEATGSAPKSSGARFAEMVKAAEVVKPQSERAKRVQEAREAARSAIKGAAEADPKAGVAAQAATAVKMELSSIEAHIVSLIRAGKFTLAAQAVADLATETTS